MQVMAKQGKVIQRIMITAQLRVLLHQRLQRQLLQATKVSTQEAISKSHILQQLTLVDHQRLLIRVLRISKLKRMLLLRQVLEQVLIL